MSLSSIADIGREQQRIYRAALNGRIDSGEASRFTYMLTQMRATHEVAQAAIDVTPSPGLIMDVVIAPIRSGTYLAPDAIRAGQPLLGTIEEPGPVAAAAPVAIDATVVAFRSRRAEEPEFDSETEPEPAA